MHGWTKGYGEGKEIWEQAMTTWYKIYPLSAQRDFWAVPMWEDKPELGSPTLEDGREVKNVIADGYECDYYRKG